MRASKRSDSRRSVIIAAALLTCLPALKPRPAEPRPSPAASPAAFSRTNIRSETAASLRMDYSWRTSGGALLSVSFAIPRAVLAEAVRDFGYLPSDLEAEVLRLEAALRQQPRLSPIFSARKIAAQNPWGRFVEIREGSDGGIVFEASSAAEAPLGLASEVAKLQARLDAEWRPCREEIRRSIREAIAGYLEKRGLVRMEGGIGVLYGDIIRRFEPVLKPLAEGIKRAGGPAGRGNDLDAVLSFVQAIPSQGLPIVRDGRYIAGFSVPLEVLAEDSGDCDSKAVLFASVWRNLHKSPLVLVRVPDHMLVGVASPRAPGASIVAGSIRYLLCEVSPEAPAPPGAVSPHTAACLEKSLFKITPIR